MDETDGRLIALLRADSRTPTAVLAKALKVSRGTIQNRMDRLKASGTLLGYTVRLGAEAAPVRIRAVMNIVIDGGKMSAILEALRGVPAVTAAHTTNGRWDLVAELETETLPLFSAALDAIRAIDGIAATETSLLLKTVKF